MNVVLEFEKRESEISPEIAMTLKDLGDVAITAYAAVGLYHNTLSRFVPSILQNGLVAENSEAAPDQADVDFAAELFEQKGYYYDASQRLFDILIKGRPADREPGVFFYPLKADATEFRAGYGVPERLHILAMEMGCVMLREDGPFTDAERQRAREIYEKYHAVILGDKESHIAVLKANPFSPSIINHRLANLESAVRDQDLDRIVQGLQVLGYSEWEGIYIPGNVPPEDLQVMDAKLPIIVSLDERQLDPSRSRFYYTPANLKRI